jgi:multidrug efflux pump
VWYRVRKHINDAKAQGTFPPEINGPFFNDEFGDTFGNIYAITGDGYTYPQLKQAAERLRDRIRRIPGVGKVEYQGVQEERIYIEYQSARLAALGISGQSIREAIATNNSVAPMGTILTGADQVRLTMSGALESLESIRNIGVTSRTGSRLRIGDIANVWRGVIDPPEFKMHFNGKNAIGLTISAREGGNVFELGKNLEATVEQFTSELPIGLEIHTVANQPEVVKEAIGEFTKSLGEAVIIVMIVSFLSLGFRPGIVVSLCIPLVLAATFLLMLSMGIDLQRISLGALIIALGLLVDDAMIVVESIETHLAQGWSAAKAAVAAYTETSLSMLTGTTITIIGYLPIGFSGGSASEYVRSLFFVVAISLGLSWIVAVLFTPYIAFRILGGSHSNGESSHHIANGHEGGQEHSSPFYEKFRAFLTQCLIFKKAVVFATLMIFAISMGIFAVLVPKQFFPASDRPELLVDLHLSKNASFEATEASTRKLERFLEGNENIDHVASYIGGGAPRFYLPLDVQAPEISRAQLVVQTKSEQVRDKVRGTIEHYLAGNFPELRGRISGLENGPPVGQPVQIRITARDHQSIQGIAEAVEALMRREATLTNVNSDYGEYLKTAHIDINQDKVRALGVDYTTVKETLAGSLDGAQLTTLREGEKSIGILARLSSDERTNLASLPYAKIPTSSGTYVPLSQIATITAGNEPATVWRRDRQAVITVYGDAVGVQPSDSIRNLSAGLEKIRENLPPGADIVVGGCEEESAKSQAAVFAVVPLSIILISLLLMIQLQSIKKMALVLATGPLALIGVAIILAIFQIPFGFVAMLGSLSLFGMVIRNSVILIDRISQLMTAGMDMYTAVVEATIQRLRPILLTAIAAILAMIPLTRSVFWGAMAWATMGGLLIATVLTLVFLPALYLLVFQETAGPAQGKVRS